MNRDISYCDLTSDIAIFLALARYHIFYTGTCMRNLITLFLSTCLFLSALGCELSEFGTVLIVHCISLVLMTIVLHLDACLHNLHIHMWFTEVGI